MKLRPAQIGRCGELLVQYRLLKHGIDSALLTTDHGIDLVAYCGHGARAITIQVKANLAAKRGGGKGKLALDWSLRSDSPAELLALVNLEVEEIWIFTHCEFMKFAQQKPEGKNRHFYFYTDPEYQPRYKNLRSKMSEFADFKLENRIEHLFNGDYLTNTLILDPTSIPV